MKITLLSTTLALGCFLSTSVMATTFDANVTSDVIFGSGNVNGGFTVDQSNGVEIGLRGKLRYDLAGTRRIYSIATAMAHTRLIQRIPLHRPHARPLISNGPSIPISTGQAGSH